MIKFDFIWALLLLPLPFLIFFTFPHINFKNQSSLVVPFFSHISNISSQIKQIKNNFKLFVASIIWILGVLAATGPYTLHQPIGVPMETRNIVMAIDISDSMAIQDMRFNNRLMSRIETVKLLGGDFIANRVGDRLGLVLFGTQAYLQTPLTYDRKTVATLLQESDLRLAGPLTAIGNAMGLSIKHLNKYSTGSKVLVLLTDGVDNSSIVSVEKMAEIAKKNNVKIYTIGIGSVNSREALDEELLKKVANDTGGKYFIAYDAKSLQSIYEYLNEVEPISEKQEMFFPKYHLYPWFLGLAFIFSIFLIGFSVLRQNGRFSFN